MRNVSYNYYSDLLINARKMGIKDFFQFVDHIVLFFWNRLISKHLNKTIYCYEVNFE